MAVADKQGRIHHSAGRAALQDEMDANKKSAGGKPAAVKQPASKGGEQAEKGSTDVSTQDIGDVVKAHGPAHHIVISHDDAGAMHTVTSHHGEKGKSHVHHSEHGTREAAMQHAQQAGAPEGSEQEEASETPGQEMDEQMQPQGGGKGIPGMAAA